VTPGLPLSGKNSIIRWAGSKRKLLPMLASRLPDRFDRYIEPFAGSACLFFHLKPQKAVLGDINKELIDFYRVLKDSPEIIWSKTKELEISEKEYYRVRDLLPEDLDGPSKAVRFYYLNRLCFNGIYRTNKLGKFNVPYGKDTGHFPDKDILIRYSKILENAELFNGDYSNCISEISYGDFIYLDPPYVTSRNNMQGEYGNGCFSFNDFPKLLSSLYEIDKIGAKFLFSYLEANEVVKVLNKNWRIEKIPVIRNIAGFSSHRAPVIEILVSNY
jgi:DNA adenine methylase